MNIEQLQGLDITKVQPEALQKAVKDLLSDYKETSDKKAFEEIAKENIEKVFLMVEKLSPKAIKKEPTETPKKKEQSKEKALKKKTVTKQLDDLSKDIKACRLKIKAFNEERRKNEPKKRPPTRYEKIKKHFISIANLIPPAHKENLKVQKQAEKVLLRAHRDIINAYRMNSLKAAQGEKAIKQKYDQLEEKSK